MIKKFKNGKVIINDTSVIIQGLFWTSVVIPRHEIEKVNIVGNFVIAIINIALIITMYRGYKMLTGNKLVTIKRRWDDEDYSFWMPSNEVREFRSYL